MRQAHKAMQFPAGNYFRSVTHLMIMRPTASPLDRSVNIDGVGRSLSLKPQRRRWLLVGHCHHHSSERSSDQWMNPNYLRLPDETC